MKTIWVSFQLVIHLGNRSAPNKAKKHDLKILHYCTELKNQTFEVKQNYNGDNVLFFWNKIKIEVPLVTVVVEVKVQSDKIIQLL